MKMKDFELQRVENLGSTIDSIGVDHSNRGQLYVKKIMDGGFDARGSSWLFKLFF